MDQVILYEVVRDINIVFVDGDLESKLVELETIHRRVISKAHIAFLVFEDDLDVCTREGHVVGSLKHYLVHMLIVVAHTVVNVQESLIWVVHKLNRQRCRFFLRQRDLTTSVFSTQKIDKGANLLVGLVPLL